MAFSAKSYDFLGRTRRLFSQTMGDVVVGLIDTTLGMAIETAAQCFLVGYHMFFKSVVKGVEMAELAVGFCLFYVFGVFRLDTVDTLAVYVYYFFVRKFLL